MLEFHDFVSLNFTSADVSFLNVKHYRNAKLSKGLLILPDTKSIASQHHGNHSPILIKHLVNKEYKMKDITEQRS
jgi:hypothetical protein